MRRILSALILLLLPFTLAVLPQAELIKPSLESRLEQERLAALPALREKLADPTLRERADITIVLDESLFNKVLKEYSNQSFGSGSLFQIKLHNPQARFRNALALIVMEIELVSSNPLLSGLGRLKAAARLNLTQDNGVLSARMQIVGLESASSSGLSPEQLNSILPPFQLPLQFDFDKTIQPEPIRQSSPVAFEATIEPRRVSGRMEIIDLLPLDGRLVLLAKMRNLSVTEVKTR